METKKKGQEDIALVEKKDFVSDEEKSVSPEKCPGCERTGKCLSMVSLDDDVRYDVVL